MNKNIHTFHISSGTAVFQNMQKKVYLLLVVVSLYRGHTLLGMLFVKPETLKLYWHDLYDAVSQATAP